MDIVEILKTHNTPKSKFAVDFLLSRPTLDEYIVKYNSSQKLPKDKYQIIFDSLFKEELSHEVFRKRYINYRRLIRRDSAIKLDDVDPEATDLIVGIVNNLRKSLDDNSLDFVRFISYVSDGYIKNEELPRVWSLYFNELNNLSNKKDITDKQKKYLGTFYELNRRFLEADNELDVLSYDNFLKRKKELAINNKLKTKKVEDRINEIIGRKVAEELAKSSSEDSIDDIVMKVLSNIN